MTVLKLAVKNWKDEMRTIGLEAGNPVSAAIEIDRSPAAVWEALSQAGYLQQCHPFCESTEVERWPGVGARDSITYYSGIRYQRNFVAWEDGAGYDIELGDHPNLSARVLWRVDSADENATSFSIEVFPLLKAGLTEQKKQARQERLFGPVLKHYLECVVKGVDHFVTTGTPVRPNQFGRNSMYSGPG